ncbi:epimerase [Sinisalibacter lacisalsi]|uniref:Epimerase n=2 Tax=Sinisalibacter lacisalsi TaxID=1526570 RepID=A0ABQ1QMK8_9RHOB|nr:epimerase [Sinisalibacter lacisalsi]
MRIVITGAKGLIGWHAHVRLHAANCAARFRGEAEPFEIVVLDHAGFDEDATLESALGAADGLLHFAGVNRASEAVVEAVNPAIARRLTDACRAAGAAPHIVYANSTHAAGDTTYGRSKRMAGEILSEATTRYTDLVLPHIFGEEARPFYNNVTATLIAQILAGETPSINPEGRVQLLHAGAAAQMAIDAVTDGATGRIDPEATDISVTALHEKLRGFHDNYSANIYPDLAVPFDRDLFNTYRAATYPDGWPRPLKLNSDARGTLFEAVKGGGGGQAFLSTTKPGVTRGDHFHLRKVERFLVIQGEAIIRVRKVISDEVWEYRVSGDVPAPVDMPTLHTHSIENVGETDLLTLFWTHELFDPAAPDTFADKVLK